LPASISSSAENPNKKEKQNEKAEEKKKVGIR
jgi:hypothetical protein